MSLEMAEAFARAQQSGLSWAPMQAAGGNPGSANQTAAGSVQAQSSRRLQGFKVFEFIDIGQGVPYFQVYRALNDQERAALPPVDGASMSRW